MDHIGTVGTYPPVRISKDLQYVILLICGSRHMDSGALDHDLEMICLLGSKSTFALEAHKLST
jgi:hypothetical protein